MLQNHFPLTLIILDGWGYSANSEDNAIMAANTPTWDQLIATYPHTLLQGSGSCVGLPEGQMGNSEVGHLNLGAGRMVYQDFTRIEKAISDESFYENPVLITAIEHAIKKNSAIHVLGLLSPGGVHSHERQIHSLLRLVAQHDVKKLYLHAFLDGRDTPPQSAQRSLQDVDNLFKSLGTGNIASIIGRYYAMDRDQRWNRIQQAYVLLTEGKAPYQADNATEGLKQAYSRGETDEFVKPTAIHSPTAAPIFIADDDVVIFMNYRADRARELCHALLDEHFQPFERHKKPRLASFVTLTHYADQLPTQVVFPPERLNNILGEYLSRQGMHQLRIAETEKYAHVTFFFNGGIEQPYPNEDRILIPSPNVATYDLKPEMSAFEITEQLVTAINSRRYEFIVCNYANADMVGHSGNFAATVKAIEVLDQCLAHVIAAAQQRGGEILITADHGNAERMFDKTLQQPHTAHTSEPVPFIYIGRPAQITSSEGTLVDIAPTILYLMNLMKPAEMTGHSLVKLT
jgi:2,3-bisphosphoglycerate-independent phosphoglycerate mutase